MENFTSMEYINFIFRWGHLVFGIAWIGFLYYFNFVQGGYFKQASPEGLADAKAKLAPSALWWFRWGAMLTFLTGLVLLMGVQGQKLMNDYIVVGALFGTLMFLNVWLVIWPNQKIALGLAEGGDGPAAAAKALLASRTNTLFSAPMAYCMLASPHLGYDAGNLLSAEGGGVGLYVMLALLAVLEANALFGKQGPLTTVRGVITSSFVLTAVMVLVLQFF